MWLHPVTIETRMVCGGCGNETVIFSCELDPMDPSSLGRAEARVDREIGVGIEARCSACASPCSLVRTYMDGELVEELGCDEFNAKYRELGESECPGYG